VSNVYVLDACALIAILKDEDGADSVETVYQMTSKGEAKLLMNKVNLYEAYYGFYREKWKQYADRIVDGVRLSIITICDFSDEIFSEAGRLKASYKISLADSIVLAQTIISDGILLTADHHEFDKVEQSEKISFQWIR